MPGKFSEIALKTYYSCNESGYSGWDPYDGLNSKVFSNTPLNSHPAARLFWIQVFKHSPINFRRLLFVAKGKNPKGLALVLSALCNFIDSPLIENGSAFEAEILDEIVKLANCLLALRSPGYQNYCWGYDFPWQSRAFYLPRWTPTVVCSSFVVDALLEAYKKTNRDEYLDACISCNTFVADDLNRIETPTGEGFSYSPLDHRLVYNATLLATRQLAAVSSTTGDKALLPLAKTSIESTREAFCENGAILHSQQVGKAWRDNFHTGFKLEALSRYQSASGDVDYATIIENSKNYWIENFFLSDGTAKYYDNATYPLDIHCAAQFFPTIFHLELRCSHEQLAGKVINHMIDTFYKGGGKFRFQRKKRYPINIDYFRWGNAWALYGMSYYLRMYEV